MKISSNKKERHKTRLTKLKRNKWKN